MTLMMGKLWLFALKSIIQFCVHTVTLIVHNYVVFRTKFEYFVIQVLKHQDGSVYLLLPPQFVSGNTRLLKLLF